MKRFLSLLLPGAMILALLVPFTLAGGASAASSNEGTLEPTGKEAAASPQGKVAQTSVQNAKAANQSSYVNFEDLRKLLTKYSKNVKALRATIDSLGGSISTAPNAEMLQAITSITQSYLIMKNFISSDAYTALPETDPQKAVYMGLYGLLEMQKISMESQQAQLEDAQTTIETTENTLNDSINQIVKGAETLYIAIVTMEASVKDIERGIETLDRAVALVEKQQELGMASAYDVESIRHQRSTVQSQLESLQYQIKTSKMTLEGMLGMEVKGTVTLNSLPMPTTEDLDKINYDKQLNIALRRNVDVKNADLKDDAANSTASGYTLDAAEETFTYKFKLVCLNVPEQQRLVNAAQETLDFQKRTFEIAAKKYELGMLSHEEYLSAESDVKSAESSLFSAQLNLFTAYRNYIYAYQYGIV